MFFEDGCVGQGRLRHLEATEVITYLTCTSQLLWNVTLDAGCLSFMEQLANSNCFKLALRKRDLRIYKLQLSYIQMCIIIMKTIWWLFRSNNRRGGLEFVQTLCQSSYYRPNALLLSLLTVFRFAHRHCIGLWWTDPQWERIGASLLTLVAVCHLYKAR